jgi:transcriptional regulator with XRE-family HTH domain
MSILDESAMVKTPAKPPESQLVQNVRRLMKKLGRNARQVCEKGGIPGSTVLSELFSGKTRIPTLPILQALARGLDTNIESLTGPPGIPSRASSFSLNTQIPG